MSDRLDAALAELAAAIREEVREELVATSSGPDRLLDVEEAQAMLGIGRSSLYTELKTGRLASIHVGRRRLIPAWAVAEYIRARAAA